MTSFPPTKTGTVPFSHHSLPSNKPCETWYKIIGDLSSSKSGRPLVTLHGGPGACHNYLLTLTRLYTDYGIPIVFYDQLGNGNSTHLREKRLDETFWNPGLFIAELENLLSHLGIQDDYDLLGQSWGGMLGAQFAITHPRGLKRLIISNSPASMKLWVESCNRWREELPREIDETISKHEKQGSYEDEEYQKAVMYFYKRHLCQTGKDGKKGTEGFPKDVQDSLDWLEKDDTVYRTMNGPSEFTVVGNLKTWDVTAQVGGIEVPTLVLNGEMDEARDSVCWPFFRGIGKCRWYTFTGTSHMSNVEDEEKYMEIVGGFLLEM
jgi:proline-specific peptidase